MKPSRKDEIDREIKAKQQHSDRVFKNTKKNIASLNKVLSEENHFYLQLMLIAGDKRRKT